MITSKESKCHKLLPSLEINLTATKMQIDHQKKATSLKNEHSSPSIGDEQYYTCHN